MPGRQRAQAAGAAVAPGGMDPEQQLSLETISLCVLLAETSGCDLMRDGIGLASVCCILLLPFST